MQSIRERLLGKARQEPLAGIRSTPERHGDAVPKGSLILDRYRVPSGAKADASAEVTIFEKGSVGGYHVSLPELDGEEETALELLKSNLRNAVPADATGGAAEVLGRYLAETASGAGLEAVVTRSRDKLRYYLLKDFAGFWEVDPLVGDDLIEEISLTRHDRPVRVVRQASQRTERRLKVLPRLGFKPLDT